MCVGEPQDGVGGKGRPRTTLSSAQNYPPRSQHAFAQFPGFNLEFLALWRS